MYQVCDEVWTEFFPSFYSFEFPSCVGCGRVSTTKVVFSCFRVDTCACTPEESRHAGMPCATHGSPCPCVARRRDACYFIFSHSFPNGFCVLYHKYLVFLAFLRCLHCVARRGNRGKRLPWGGSVRASPRGPPQRGHPPPTPDAPAPTLRLQPPPAAPEVPTRSESVSWSLRQRTGKVPGLG